MTLCHRGRYPFFRGFWPPIPRDPARSHGKSDVSHQLLHDHTSCAGQPSAKIPDPDATSGRGQGSALAVQDTGRRNRKATTCGSRSSCGGIGRAIAHAGGSLLLDFFLNSGDSSVKVGECLAVGATVRGKRPRLLRSGDQSRDEVEHFVHPFAPAPTSGRTVRRWVPAKQCTRVHQAQDFAGQSAGSPPQTVEVRTLPRGLVFAINDHLLEKRIAAEHITVSNTFGGWSVGRFD